MKAILNQPSDVIVANTSSLPKNVSTKMTLKNVGKNPSKIILILEESPADIVCAVRAY